MPALALELRFRSRRYAARGPTTGSERVTSASWSRSVIARGGAAGATVFSTGFSTGSSITTGAELSSGASAPAFVARIAPLFLRGLGATWRFEATLPEGASDVLERRRAVVIALWHEELLPILWQHRGLGISAVVSVARDGQYLADAEVEFNASFILGGQIRGVAATGREHHGQRDDAAAFIEADVEEARQQIRRIQFIA